MSEKWLNDMNKPLQIKTEITKFMNENDWQCNQCTYKNFGNSTKKCSMCDKVGR